MKDPIWHELLECLQEAVLAPGAAPASPLQGDVFDITLPPAPAADVAPAAMRAFALLYLLAELEQAGVIVAAELLAQSRFDLPIRGQVAARKLELFADTGRRALTRDQRDYLFARVLGMGRVSAPAAVAVNQEFPRLLLSLCEALRSYDEEALWTPAAPGALRLERVRAAAAALVSNLSARQYGNTLIAARQINATLKQAIDLLSDPAILQYFRGRTIWDVLRGVFGDLTPDIGRLVSRGQSGAALLNWIAEQWQWCVRAVAGPPSAGALRTAAAFAAQWLDASGLVPARAKQERTA